MGTKQDRNTNHNRHKKMKLKNIKIIRERYSALDHLLPWAISFFLNQEKINIFHLMHIALFMKVIYSMQNL